MLHHQNGILASLVGFNNEIGTVDSKRLRKDLLQHFRTAPNCRTPEGRRKLEAIQYANEQQLVALAKQEGFEMRPYIR